MQIGCVVLRGERLTGVLKVYRDSSQGRAKRPSNFTSVRDCDAPRVRYATVEPLRAVSGQSTISGRVEKAPVVAETINRSPPAAKPLSKREHAEEPLDLLDKRKKRTESKPCHVASSIPSTDDDLRLQIVERVRNDLQNLGMLERLAALRFGAMEITGTECVVFMVAYFIALYSGVKRTVHAATERGLVREVFDGLWNLPMSSLTKR